jgi:hypothetical protein
MIVARLAMATLGEKSNTDWMGLVADYDRIRDKIALVFDEFADFNRALKCRAAFICVILPVSGNG